MSDNGVVYHPPLLVAATKLFCIVTSFWTFLQQHAQQVRHQKSGSASYIAMY